MANSILIISSWIRNIENLDSATTSSVRQDTLVILNGGDIIWSPSVHRMSTGLGMMLPLHNLGQTYIQ